MAGVTWGGKPRALAWLPSFLFSDRGPPWRYVLLAWPLTIIPSLWLGYLSAAVLGPGASGPDLGPPGVLIVVAVVLVSPFVETLILAGPVTFLARRFGPTVAVVGSAALWAGAHSLLWARWGLVIWWPFLIFSIAFVTWRERGFWRATVLVTAIHALQNLVPMILLLAA